MIPYKWDEMVCLTSKQTEKRKVALPNFEHF